MMSMSTGQPNYRNKPRGHHDKLCYSPIVHGLTNVFAVCPKETGAGTLSRPAGAPFRLRRPVIPCPTRRRPVILALSDGLARFACAGAEMGRRNHAICVKSVKTGQWRRGPAGKGGPNASGCRDSVPARRRRLVLRLRCSGATPLSDRRPVRTPSAGRSGFPRGRCRRLTGPTDV